MSVKFADQWIRLLSYSKLCFPEIKGSTDKYLLVEN